jgi:putative ABC transport system permease protein
MTKEGRDVFDQFRQDYLAAWRGLRRAPGFAALAMLTLAVGIAGTTAMFALVHGILLRPLPVRAQERLILAWREAPGAPAARWSFNAATDIPVIAASSRSLEGVAGIGHQVNERTVVSENGVAGYVNLLRVTGDFFSVLGVRPTLGRALGPEDDVEGAPRVAVITNGLWQRRCGGAPTTIGRTFIINEQPFTIVGIMPPDVEYPAGVDVWVTARGIASSIRDETFREATVNELNIVARLRAGVTLEQAAAELRALAPRLDEMAPENAISGLIPVVQSYERAVVGDVRGALLVLFAAVAIVLLIASANVANLLLMRGEGRRAEVAVRAALGATRARLLRQLTAESVLLAAGAAAVGLVVTVIVMPSLLAYVPEGLPRLEAVRIDGRVMLFTALVSGVTAVIAGLSPAFSSTGTDLAVHLRSGTRGAPGHATRRGRRGLAVVQVALAVVVVAAAGLLIRSVDRLQMVGARVGADRLVLVPLSLPQEKYVDRERRLQFLNAAVARLESTPAIAAATPINMEPFSGASWGVPGFTAEGQTRDRAAANPSLDLEAVHPGYFDTFQLPLARGRSFTPADVKDATPVAIVSEDVAARTWPGEDPIGKRLKMGPADGEAPWMVVVGVARSTRYRELDEARPTMYVPAEQLIVTADTLVLRTNAPPAVIRSLVAEQLRAIDPDVAVVRVAPFRDLLDRPLARPRFNAFLTTVFGVTALFLAAVGLFTVMAAFVRLHHRDIGVRVAIGATAADVRRLVVREAAWLAGIGAAIGIGISLAGNQLLRGLLYDITPLDPIALLAAPTLIVIVSILACYVPARRATRIEPAMMLRAD